MSLFYVPPALFEFYEEEERAEMVREGIAPASWREGHAPASPEALRFPDEVDDTGEDEDQSPATDNGWKELGADVLWNIAAAADAEAGSEKALTPRPGGVDARPRTAEDGGNSRHQIGESMDAELHSQLDDICSEFANRGEFDLCWAIRGLVDGYRGADRDDDCRAYKKGYRLGEQI